MPLATCKRKLQALTSDERFAGILRGSIWAMAGQAISALLSMVVSILVARLYGAEVMGTVAVITSVLTLLTTFTVLGMDTSILRLLQEHLVKYSAASALNIYRKIRTMVAWPSLGAGLLLFLGAQILAEKVFGKPHLAFYLALIAPFVLISSLKTINTQALRGLLQIRSYSLMLVLPALANLLFLLLLKVTFFNPDDPIYSLLASLFLSGLVGWIILRKSFTNKIGAEDRVQAASCRSILDISLPMLVTSYLFFFIAQSGTMILGIFHPEEQIGYYDVAMKLSAQVTFILTAINAMVAPRFAELYHAGKMEELFHVARKAAKLIFWTTAPLLLFLIILGKPLLGFVFGAKFINAYPSLVLLAIGQFANASSGATGFFIYMTGDEKILRNCAIITALVNIVLGFILIPKFGIIGASLATAAGVTFLNGISLLYTKKKYGRSTGYFPFLSH